MNPPTHVQKDLNKPQKYSLSCWFEGFEENKQFCMNQGRWNVLGNPLNRKTDAHFRMQPAKFHANFRDMGKHSLLVKP